jgi:hypothetical protein
VYRPSYAAKAWWSFGSWPIPVRRVGITHHGTSFQDKVVSFGGLAQRRPVTAVPPISSSVSTEVASPAEASSPAVRSA